MSLDQFKRRTSRLEIPKETYELFDEVVKACSGCRGLVKQYPRSKVSGIRADSFGDTVGIDLCFPTVFGEKRVVFVSVDLATSLVFCELIEDNSIDCLQRAIISLIDQWHLTPKRIVCDTEFVTAQNGDSFGPDTM